MSSDGQPLQGRTSAFLNQEASNSSTIADLPTALRQGLETLDSERKKRNEDRKKRRDEGQLHVSDDEPDLITPLLSSITQPQPSPGSPPGPQSTTLTSPSASSPVSASTNAPRTTSKIYLRDDEASTNVFTADDHTIPNAIYVPPLSLFLPNSLERARHGHNIKFVKVGSGPNANVRILNVSDFPKYRHRR